MAYNLACWCIQMAYTQHSWMLMDIVVGLYVRPSVRLFVYGIFRWLCICWQITWNKWHKIWHADVSLSLISVNFPQPTLMLNHVVFLWFFFCFFFAFFFLRLGLGQRKAVVIIGRWLLPSLVDTGDICCHYWQHILVFNLVLLIGIFRSSHGNALSWMSHDLIDDKSTLVEVMAWCHQATSHYLSQCWPRSLSPYGVTRPQWVNSCTLEKIKWVTFHRWNSFSWMKSMIFCFKFRWNSLLRVQLTVSQH